jgi:hypothetical protein
MHVYSPAGTLIGTSAKLQESKYVDFRHSGRFRNRPYEVRVVPWLVVPGTTYRETARVK